MKEENEKRIRQREKEWKEKEEMYRKKIRKFKNQKKYE